MSEKTKRFRFPQNQHMDDHFDWWNFMPMGLMHVALIGIWWTGFTWTSVAMCAFLYVARVFGITAGYHRYFSHRGYKTSRVFQFLLALLGSTALQKGPLWWSAKHREHHRDTDEPEDAHSPRHYGFLDAHVGWVYREARSSPDMDLIKDFSKYPEIRWIERHQFLPGVTLAVICFLIGGWSGLLVGWLLSTILVYHATFTINSLDHMFGRQRYLTGDDSRNNWIMALLSLGEGWHNNHHYYPATARNGFFWWEFDPTYYMLVGLEKVGLVWDLRQPPKSILANEKPPTQKIIDKCAVYIAAGFSADRISANIRERWEGSHVMEDLRKHARDKWSAAEAYLAEVELPEFPSVDELKARAHKQFKIRHEGLDRAIERAQDMLRRSVAHRLIEQAQSEQGHVQKV
ncbi:acyl-CoA desaturase [Salinisphaera hydrothermalis]|uniref:acyl-CoA desaturase n=1 Tax=Salinisphaera hydrothermalis TaxID=563188 RepID=UPI0033426D54